MHTGSVNGARIGVDADHSVRLASGPSWLKNATMDPPMSITGGTGASGACPSRAAACRSRRRSMKYSYASSTATYPYG